MMDLKGKKVTVIGLAKSGLSAALLLKENGAIVGATDSGASAPLKEAADILEKQGIEVEIGRHSRAFIEGSDLIVKSPGVPESAEPVLWARQRNKPLISEIELASWFCSAPIIAVTGTNGKSTVTTLIGKILNDAGKNAVVCGNIGEPFSGQLDNIDKADAVVLEVSSFQLDDIKYFRPRVAVLLNATQNHLDRHKSFEEYLGAKKRIFANQGKGDYAVLFYDDPVVRNLAGEIRAGMLYFSSREKVAGAYQANGELMLNAGGKERFVMKANELRVPGEHNILNALACIIAASVFGIDEASIARALSGFGGLEHRFEYVATVNGVRYINDSKATSVDATANALRSLEGDVILIAGGRDKNSDFGAIKDLIGDKARTVILIGEARQKIESAIRDRVSIEFAGSLDGAVKKASAISQKDTTVLFSPMCTSFDMFRDFEERGRVFKDAVRRLSGK